MAWMSKAFKKFFPTVGSIAEPGIGRRHLPFGGAFSTIGFLDNMTPLGGTPLHQGAATLKGLSS